MIKTLAGSIREFRKESLKAPFYVSLEVLMETLIPYIMAQMIDIARMARPIYIRNTPATARPAAILENIALRLTAAAVPEK